MFLLSLPMRGAWIEILRCLGSLELRMVAPHAGAWIEILPHR